jgi:dienelactone hydrolase
MKSTSTLLAITLLALSGTCGAQLPPGVTPEMIATVLPEEGAPKAEPGPYQVVSEPAFGQSGLMTFRPADLGRFPKSDTLPVVVWGNGGCAINNPKYAGFLSTIASHGFLVVTTTGEAGEGAPSRATADHLKAGIDWAEKENARSGSPLQGKVETRRVAVMGQSCGGVLSITLGADPRVGTIGVFNSGLQIRNEDGSGPIASSIEALKKLHGPVLIIDGHERDFAMARAKETYDALESVPVFYGSRHGAGHTATAYHVGGGEFANVASNWVKWQFKGDKKAGAMFVGEKCGLCTNPNWEVASKRLRD